MESTITSIGMMSGSSLDGLDMACALFTVNPEADTPQEWLLDWNLVATAMISFPESWTTRLREAPGLSGLQLAKIHTDFGSFLGQHVRQFVQEYQLQPDCIASHGHTIFHYPEAGFTTQIGCGATIAALAGATTIDNFRALDLALGGQGAPLAPIADEYLFGSYDICLNLGGIANLSTKTKAGYVAFDIGGANQILNAIVQPLGLAYDEGGQMARLGQLQPALLEKVNALPYFSQPYPKSLGNNWVKDTQWPIFANTDCSTEDKLNTACWQIAGQIAKAIAETTSKTERNGQLPKVFVTGGGAFNHFLLECIDQACAHKQPIDLIVPEPDIINFKEALLMALMGALRLSARTNCRASVTGASRDCSGGSIHYCPSVLT
ncbi:MAG: anhydro-N-acetylmuramic acid kinase [Saprospiraceae bacterium]|nr:MAG: anhydro-N-acetylmuramic acid kinase [Saprospiraceae bacterium]